MSRFQQNLLYIFRNCILLYMNVQRLWTNKYKQGVAIDSSPEASRTQRCYWASLQEHGATAGQASWLCTREKKGWFSPEWPSRWLAAYGTLKQCVVTLVSSVDWRRWALTPAVLEPHLLGLDGERGSAQRPHWREKAVDDVLNNRVSGSSLGARLRAGIARGWKG
jgi:hypothetical protein